MEIPVVKLKEWATIPTKSYKTDAGWDLYSTEDVEILAGQRVLVSTGIGMAIPAGFAGLIWPRSGLSVKQGIDVLAGVIDHGYTGEIKVCLLNTNPPRLSEHFDVLAFNMVKISRGDRIAQLVIQPILPSTLKVLHALPESDRSSRGFGSSGS